MSTFVRRRYPSHVVKVEDLKPYIDRLEQEVAAAGIERRVGQVIDVEGKERDFSAVDHKFRKRLLACYSGPKFRVEIMLAGVIDKPTILYLGDDLAKAAETYNDLG